VGLRALLWTTRCGLTLVGIFWLWLTLRVAFLLANSGWHGVSAWVGHLSFGPLEGSQATAKAGWFAFAGFWVALALSAVGLFCLDRRLARRLRRS